jgi:hypothetical protein
MSSRRVSPIAKARAGKVEKSEVPPIPAPPAGRASPIARAREDTKKGERRKSAEKGQRVSPIARARESKKKSPEVLQKNLDIVDEDEELPPLSVPFGLECYLTHKEIKLAKDYIVSAFAKRRKSDTNMTSFQIYTVDYSEEEAEQDLAKEYESVLVFHWFRPAVGVNIKDIMTVWDAKREKWYELLRVAGLMPKDKVLKDIEFPEMLDPVEEEDEEE